MNPQQNPDRPRLNPHWTPLTKGVVNSKRFVYQELYFRSTSLKIKKRRHHTDPCRILDGPPEDPKTPEGLPNYP